MPKERISIFYESEKMRAIKYCCDEKGKNVNDEIEKQMDELYLKLVPEDIRKYIEAKIPESKNTKKPKSKNKNTEKPDTE